MAGRIRRLYRGETNIQFIATRKRWYLASAIMLVICIASIIFRGFNFGIDFSGGTQFTVPVNGGQITTSQVDTAFVDAGVKAVVQPGGSVRDEEVVAAAEAAGVTLYLTGARHFFHG